MLRDDKMKVGWDLFWPGKQNCAGLEDADLVAAALLLIIIFLFHNTKNPWSPRVHSDVWIVKTIM